MAFTALSRPHLRLRSYLAFGVFLALTLILAACGNETNTGGSTETPCPKTTSLSGAGATFPNPLYSKMFDEYAKIGCQVEVNYQPVGSGAGITQLLNQTVDFGASDSPMSDDQLSQSKNGNILHIPGTIGAVPVIYNLAEVPASTHLQLDGATLANIFLGTIKFWDDAAIKATNAGVTLPHKTITVVHRSDGSGTTGIFTHYLEAVSADWASKVGSGTTVNWPTGVGANGNSGLTTAVKNTAGSIGYTELAYALTNNVQYAAVQSKDGQFVVPSLDSAKAAAASITTIPDDLRFFFVNAPGQNAYPISGFSWILVYEKQADADKGQAVANLVWWMIHDGQQYSSALNYVPLPDNIVQRGEAKVKAMQCGGSACYKG